jgi:hypothetical protein
MIQGSIGPCRTIAGRTHITNFGQDLLVTPVAFTDEMQQWLMLGCSPIQEPSSPPSARRSCARRASSVPCSNRGALIWMLRSETAGAMSVVAAISLKSRSRKPPVDIGEDGSVGNCTIEVDVTLRQRSKPTGGDPDGGPVREHESATDRGRHNVECGWGIGLCLLTTRISAWEKERMRMSISERATPRRATRPLPTYIARAKVQNGWVSMGAAWPL